MHFLTKTTIALTLIALSASAMAGEDKKSAGPLLSFTVEASQTVANDLARATVFTEAIDTQPGEVARKVNATLAKAIALAKSYPEIKTKSGATWTTPVYGKNGHSIESWHMRSEIQLESQKIATLGELLSKLQGELGVSQVTLQATEETRHKAEDLATLDAIKAFQSKAQLIASGFKKNYRINSMTFNGSNQGPVYPLARPGLMKMDAAPMPIESGESTVSVTASGEIELVD